MARETKVQKEARWAAENAEHLAVEQANYEQRLRDAMFKAQTFSVEMSMPSANSFELRFRDDEETFAFSATHTDVSQRELEELERFLEFLTEQKAEHDRRALLRTTALAKLSKEEREVLEV